MTPKKAEYQRKYREKNREILNEKRRIYYYKNLEQSRKTSLDFYHKNIEKGRQQNRDYCHMVWAKRKMELKYLVFTLYGGMYARVKGFSGKGRYNGLLICSRKEFYEFSLNNPQLKSVFLKWKKNNYHPKFAPTVDRKNNLKGYTLDNIQFLSKSDNTIKGHLERKK